MSQTQKHSSLVIGLALFSMFFGSGNLIYPLFIGKIAEQSWVSAALGFCCTGVLFPFLGVIAMVLYKGSYSEFFNLFGKRFGFLLTLAILTVWIPLGSAPRCVILSYSSMKANLAMPPLWLFSAFYCLLLYFVVRNKSRMLDILGYVLTPTLLEIGRAHV